VCEFFFFIEGWRILGLLHGLIFACILSAQSVFLFNEKYIMKKSKEKKA